MAKCRHPKRRVVYLGDSIRCYGRGAHLPLGPSNDEPELVACEISRAAWVRSDAGWARFEDADALDWDPSRPLAYQWPWNGHPTREASDAHNAAGDAQIDALINEQTRHDVAASVVRHAELEPQLTPDEVAAVIAQSSNSFAPFDTASHEPWHGGVETQDSGVSIDETRPIGGVTSAEVVEVESLCAPIVAALTDLSMTAEPPEGWKERTMAAIDDRFDPDGEL